MAVFKKISKFAANLLYQSMGNRTSHWQAL